MKTFVRRLEVVPVDLVDGVGDRPERFAPGPAELPQRRRQHFDTGPTTARTPAVVDDYVPVPAPRYLNVHRGALH
jgi:hypothetical protein